MNIKKFKEKLWPYYDIVRSKYNLAVSLTRGLIQGQKPDNCYDIPIIINNFNQYDYLIKLIESLQSRGYTNIHILDNDSTYPPLLEYYDKCGLKIHKLGANLGHMALWKSGLYKKFQNQYFVYSDPDVLLCEECPADFLEYFYQLFQKYHLAIKVGFSLRIDDLPEHYPLKENVVNWEKRYWIKEEEPGVYRAPIDTTFALYRPFTKPTCSPAYKMLRTGFPYQVRHLPWYVDPKHMTENEIYYRTVIETKTHWSDKS